MFSILKNQKGVANRFLVYALGLHAGLLFAINNYGGEIKKMFPEGTQTTIEFTAIEAPKGFQTDTRDTGPMVETVSVKKVTEIASKETKPKVLTQLPEKEPAVQEPEKELAVQEAEKELAIQEPEKELATQEAEKELATQEAEKELATQEAEKELAIQEAEKELAIQEAEKELATQEAEKELAIQEAEKELAVQEAEKELAVQEAAAPEVAPVTKAKVDETPVKDTETAKSSQSETTPPIKETKAEETKKALPVAATKVKTQSISGTTANNQDGKGKVQYAPQSDLKFGVSQGTRTVNDLRQYPGNTPPRYPKSSRLRGEKGHVILSYYVTPQGQVTNVRIKSSSGFSKLDNEAVKAIRKYRFHPGQQGQTLHPVNFDLKGQVQQAGGLLRSSLK